MSFKIIQSNMYLKNLYVYKRNIQEKYLNKFNNYEIDNFKKLNLTHMKNTINKLNFVDAIFNKLTPDILYKLYHMKLIALDIITNKSFSFKCLKSNVTFITTLSFHKLLRNNKSISGGEYDDIIVYLFINTPEPFVVGVGNGSYWGVLHNEIHFVYYFKTNEMYYFKQDSLNHVEETKKEICENIVDYCKKNNFKKNDKTCMMFGFQVNIGHTYWNELSSFKFLLDIDILKDIDLFIIGPYDYFDIYNYLIQKGLNVKRENSIKNINNILNNNYLLVKINEWFMYEHLKNFVMDNHPYDISDKTTLNYIDNIQNTFYPIITINLRAIHRFWYDQENGFANIINSLLLLYPKLFVIFDGYIKNKNLNLDDYMSEGIKSSADDFDESYNNILNNIISKINTKNFHSLIGVSLNEQIAWLQISNYGIMQLGAGAFNYTWLMNKKCLFVGRNEIINDQLLMHCWHDFYFRENRDFTTYIHPNLIDFQSHKNYKNSFYIDWKIIFFHVLRDIILLEKNNFKLSQYENIKNYNIYINFGLDIDINALINMDFYSACNIIKKFVNKKL